MHIIEARFANAQTSEVFLARVLAMYELQGLPYLASRQAFKYLRTIFLIPIVSF